MIYSKMKNHFLIGKKALRRMVDDADHLSSKIFSGIIQVLIFISLMSFCIDTIPDLSKSTQKILYIIEIGTITIFTTEYLLRLFVAEKKLKYVFSFYGFIDLVAIAPFYLSMVFAFIGLDLRFLRVIRLARLMRMLKVINHSQAIDSFTKALKIAKNELSVFGFAAMILLFISAAGVYLFEQTDPKTEFKSVFHSLWWAVITLTTVGYGDMTPMTLGGRILTFVILSIGIGIIAVPSGIIASALSQVRNEPHNVKRKIPEENENPLTARQIRTKYEDLDNYHFISTDPRKTTFLKYATKISELESVDERINKYYVAYRKNGNYFTSIVVQKKVLKIYFDKGKKKLDDPRNLLRKYSDGYIYVDVDEYSDFNYVFGLIKQAYDKSA